MTSEARTPERTDRADRVRPESSPAVGGSVARGGATTEPRTATTDHDYITHRLPSTTGSGPLEGAPELPSGPATLKHKT
jgi:hypothetical protein